MQIKAAEITSASASLHPRQFRAARALLGWNLMEASRRTLLSVAAINAVERAASHAHHQSVHQKLRAAYEAAGVLFDAQPGMSLSVSLRQVKVSA